jgi:hypothetical protein
MSQKRSKKINKKSTVDIKVICLLCNKTYASASSLSHHKKRCKNKNIITDINHSKREQELLNTINNLTRKVSPSTISSHIYPTYITEHNNLNQNIEKSSNIFICTYCNRNDFTHQPNLSRHMKSCGRKVELEQKIESLLKEKEEWIKDKENLLKDKETLNKDKETLNKDKEMFADIAVTNTNTVSSSISAMKYFMINFKNTPALKSIEDLSTMKIKYEDNLSFIMQLLSVYQNNNLPAYIGEYIVNVYKTNDSSKQAMWSSDVDRLTYIISEAVKDKTIWITDKKGIKVGERVIRPALDYIKPILQTFIKDCNNEIASDRNSNNRQTQLLEFQKYASHIILSIDNKSLEKDIIKYIAPKLYWNKNTLLDTEKTVKIKEIKHVKKRKSHKEKYLKPVKQPKKKKNKIIVVESESDEDLVESDSESE